MIPMPPPELMASYILALEAEVKRLRGEYRWIAQLPDGPPTWQPSYPSNPHHARWQPFMARPELLWTMADSKPFQRKVTA